MAQNDVKFIKGSGTLGRALPGEDFISGLIFYTGSLPSGFSSGARTKQIFSVAEAEALGITNTSSDETKAAAVYTITAVGGNGDTIEYKIVEPKKTVSLGVYTKVAGDSTVTLLAASICAMINLGTLTHGYTAAPVAGAITITARKGLGVFLNAGSPLSATIVGTMTGTLTTAFTGGVASLLDIYHYHVKEYFRLNPQGNLFLGFYAVPALYDLEEVRTMQVFSNGKIRQAAVYINGSVYSSAYITAAQVIADALEAAHMPISIVLGCDISATSDLSTLTDLSTLASKKLSLCIGQDGYGLGYELFKAYSKSITCLGAMLGAISSAAVSEDIAWVGGFNLSDGYELNVPAFANGQNNSALSVGLKDQINQYRYVFVKSFVGNTGTYFNDSHCAVAYTSDYAYIEDNRTIDKAIRLLYPAYLPYLNSKIALNADGTLADRTVANLETVGETALAQMVRDGDLAGDTVTINPSQLIKTTSKLVIGVVLGKQGIARNIEVPISF